MTALKKQKKCKVCGSLYEPRTSMQVVCGWECAVVHSKKLSDKRKAADLKRDRERLKSKAEWLKEAQAAFNAFIRERDKDLPCISCQKFHNGQYHAGHYRTTKAAPELRFDELNVHKQCSVCNNHLSGNLIAYRQNLILKIGINLVELIEGKHEPAKYTIEDLISIKALYKQKLKDLKNGK